MSQVLFTASLSGTPPAPAASSASAAGGSGVVEDGTNGSDMVVACALENCLVKAKSCSNKEGLFKFCRKRACASFRSTVWREIFVVSVRRGVVGSTGMFRT